MSESTDPTWSNQAIDADDAVARITAFFDCLQARPNAMILSPRLFRYGPLQKTRCQRKKFHETWARLLNKPVREMRMVAMGRATW